MGIGKFSLRLAIFAHFFVFAQSGSASAQDSGLEGLQLLKERFLKLYDSSEQSLFDPAYFDVTLRHCEVEVNELPSSEKNSVFLAIEQSISIYGSPYRVRLIKLSYDSDAGLYVSDNVEPENPFSYAGICTGTRTRVVEYDAFKNVKCSILIEKEGDVFVGATPREGCPSSHRGAVVFRATTRITSDTITSWDRGFDAAGNQVWGARKGPYVFKVVSEKGQHPDVVEFASFINGKRSNAEQVEADNRFFNVRYKICPVKVDDSLLDLPYTEYSLAEQYIETPGSTIRRLRLYAYSRGAGKDINFKAYKLTNESDFAVGYCDLELPLTKTIEPRDVDFNESCTMVFQFLDTQERSNRYFGSTPPNGCASSFRGSQTFTSREIVDSRQLEVEERWWDAQGKQVAGSTAGPYIYVKESEFYYPYK